MTLVRHFINLGSHAQRRRLASAIGLACLAALTGCQRSDRVGLRGTVTVDGQPLSEGTIHFAPVAGLRANTSGARIASGQYTIEAGRGLLPGAYQVNVDAFVPTGQIVHDRQRGPIEQLVAAQFREEGQLRVNVEREGPNQFDFALTQGSPTP